MPMLADVAAKLNRSTVFLSGLQKRFELPPLEDAKHPEAYLEFPRPSSPMSGPNCHL
jgi:hypothetical protein